MLVFLLGQWREVPEPRGSSVDERRLESIFLLSMYPYTESLLFLRKETDSFLSLFYDDLAQSGPSLFPFS